MRRLPPRLKAIAVAADAELTEAAAAAEKLSIALGPELTGRMNIGAVVNDLYRMGLSFEEIAADADKLADALREIDKVEVRGVESGLGKVATNTDEMADSARGANSALANMIGNAAQDLGAARRDRRVGGGGDRSDGRVRRRRRARRRETRFGVEVDGEGRRPDRLALRRGGGGGVGDGPAAAPRRRRPTRITEEFGDAMEGAAIDSTALSTCCVPTRRRCVTSPPHPTTPSATSGSPSTGWGRASRSSVRLFERASVDIVQALDDAGVSIYDFARGVDQSGAARLATTGSPN